MTSQKTSSYTSPSLLPYRSSSESESETLKTSTSLELKQLKSSSSKSLSSPYISPSLPFTHSRNSLPSFEDEKVPISDPLLKTTTTSTPSIGLMDSTIMNSILDIESSMNIKHSMRMKEEEEKGEKEEEIKEKTWYDEWGNLLNNVMAVVVLSLVSGLIFIFR